MSYYATCALPKFKPGESLPEQRADKKAKRSTADKKAKASVQAEDKRTCRLCAFRWSSQVHEALVFKSGGGVASLENSIAVCAICHPLLQKRSLIHVVGTDCRKPLIFEMGPRVAKLIFGRRPIPAHVRVLVAGLPSKPVARRLRGPRVGAPSEPASSPGAGFDDSLGGL